MEQAENQNRDARVRLKSEETLEPVHVVECLVHDGKADNCIDKKRIRVQAAQHAAQQSNAVSHSEEADVKEHILQPVEEENDAYQEEQVVISRDHMFCAEVEERSDGSSDRK